MNKVLIADKLMKLDDVFVKKDDIAIAVKTELNEAMMDYGYDIIKTLVTDIDPDPQVKIAMNRIEEIEGHWSCWNWS